MQIHKGYKSGDDFVKEYKEYSDVPGIRPDYYDEANNVIYELKPFNPSAARTGVAQLGKYNNMLCGNNTMRLEMY